MRLFILSIVFLIGMLSTTAIATEEVAKYQCFTWYNGTACANRQEANSLDRNIHAAKTRKFIVYTKSEVDDLVRQHNSELNTLKRQINELKLQLETHTKKQSEDLRGTQSAIDKIPSDLLLDDRFFSALKARMDMQKGNRNE